MLLFDAGDLFAQSFVNDGEIGLAVGVCAMESSMVYTPNRRSFAPRLKSERTVPKSSRIVCLGLLKARAMPVGLPVVGSVSSGPFCLRPELQEIGDTGGEADVYK